MTTSDRLTCKTCGAKWDFGPMARLQAENERLRNEVSRLQELVRSMVLSHPETCVPTVKGGEAYVRNRETGRFEWVKRP